MPGRVWWLCAQWIEPQKWGSYHCRSALLLQPIILPKKPQVLREPQMCIGATKSHHCHHSSAVRSCASCHSIGIYPSIYLPWKSLNPSPLENLCRVVSEVARALSRLTGATLTCAEPAIQVSPNTDQPPHHHHRHCHLRSKKTNIRSYILTVSLYYVPCKYFSSAWYCHWSQSDF